MHFSAYAREGVLAPHVRDVYGATTLGQIEPALEVLQSLAKEFAAEPEKKLRLDANEIAHRVMLEATGQAPKTVPPSERSAEEKDPVAVERGKKGGES